MSKDSGIQMHCYKSHFIRVHVTLFPKGFSSINCRLSYPEGHLLKDKIMTK